MAEPHASTIAGALAGAGLGLGSGYLFGAHIDALGAGLFAALFASIWLDSINDRMKAASAVLLSSLLAGYGSPVAAAWVVANIHGLADAASIRMPIALCIGALTPSLVPAGINRLKQMIGGKV